MDRTGYWFPWHRRGHGLAHSHRLVKTEPAEPLLVSAGDATPAERASLIKAVGEKRRRGRAGVLSGLCLPPSWPLWRPHPPPWWPRWCSCRRRWRPRRSGRPSCRWCSSPPCESAKTTSAGFATSADLPQNHYPPLLTDSEDPTGDRQQVQDMNQLPSIRDYRVATSNTMM